MTSVQRPGIIPTLWPGTENGRPVTISQQSMQISRAPCPTGYLTIAGFIR
jgi:hypothetical protein